MKRKLVLCIVALLLVPCLGLTAFAASTSSMLQEEFDADEEFMSVFEKQLFEAYGDMFMYYGNVNEYFVPCIFIVEWSDDSYVYIDVDSIEPISDDLEEDIAAGFLLQCSGVSVLNGELYKPVLVTLGILVPNDLDEFGNNIVYLLTDVQDQNGGGLPELPDDIPQNLIVYSSKEEVLYELDSPSPSVPTFATITESMSTVLDWLGTVTTSLLSGELSPLLLLLAIPIAISLIFLAIKAIKMVFNL